MRMALVEFAELSEEIKQYVMGCMEDEEECASFALAFLVDGRCKAVLLHDHYEYEVVDCEPAFFASLIRVIDEVHGALENYRFIVRPVKSSMRWMLAPGLCGCNTSGLMACCGVDETFFLRSTGRPAGFFDGPPVRVDTAIRLVRDGTPPVWQSTLLHASRDAVTGDVSVAFDPPVPRWAGARDCTDDRSLMLRRRQGDEYLLAGSETERGSRFCRLNKLMYHGRADAKIFNSYATSPFGVERESMLVVYVASATVCAARLSGDVYVDEARC